MARAPGHRLGQIIGDTLELAVGPSLAEFADRHGLYLDSQGDRPARPGKKVTWEDSLGNAHDLDHVLERGGSDDKIGVPVAFIESAWRRYTKHSRAKAQEIQGAVLPVLTTWAHVKPFAGVILAGEWTGGSLEQLRSNGFSILRIDYGTIIETFRGWDIEVRYDEHTEDRVLERQIQRWKRLADDDREALGQALRDAISDQLEAFVDDLSKAVLRRVECVSILPLHGRATDCDGVDQAIGLVESYDPKAAAGPVVRFEVIVRYDNGDQIAVAFDSAADAIDFLGSFE